MKKKSCKSHKQMWMPEQEEDDYNGMQSHNGMQLAHSYVPWQFYNKAFSPHEALMKGTLFPELYGAYPIPN